MADFGYQIGTPARDGAAWARVTWNTISAVLPHTAPRYLPAPARNGADVNLGSGPERPRRVTLQHDHDHARLIGREEILQWYLDQKEKVFLRTQVIPTDFGFCILFIMWSCELGLMTHRTWSKAGGWKNRSHSRLFATTWERCSCSPFTAPRLTRATLRAYRFAQGAARKCGLLEASHLRTTPISLLAPTNAIIAEKPLNIWCRV